MIRRLVVIGLILPVLSACGILFPHGYSKEGDIVKWFNCTESGCTSYQIWGADVESFEVLNNQYAKDKDMAYSENKPIRSADAGSFRLLRGSSGVFARDANSIYSGSRALDICDVNSFRVLRDDWQVDDECAYKDVDNKLSVEDPSSFSVLNYDFARDRYHVYRWNFGAGDVEIFDDDAVLTHFACWTTTGRLTTNASTGMGKASAVLTRPHFLSGTPTEGTPKDRNHIYWDGEIKDCQECAMNATCNKYVEPLPCPNDPE